jgi:sugar O-acyltransferase (sialic acid O-acetyltransferase NeuD family)
MAIHLVRVPLLNANEEEVEVVDIFVTPGTTVKAGDRLFVVESTKATVEVESPASGHLRRLAVEKGQRVKVQGLLAVLSDTADEPVADPAAEAPRPGGVRATRKAEELAQRHGIDLASLGIAGLIKESDVEAAVKKGAPREPKAARPPLPAPEGAKPILVYGASGHARVLVDLMRLANEHFPIGAVDDGDPTDVLGVPVIGGSDALAPARASGVALAALGIGSVTNHADRIAYWKRLVEIGFEMPNLLHPRAAIAPSAKLGAGNQVFAGAVIGSAAVIADNTIINSGVVVSHDCRIASHVHLAPGAILAGAVDVGENTLIGMGVTVYLGVKIGRNVVISNGCHIMKDVPDGTIVRASL